MSSARTASCLFCGRTAALKSVTASVKIDCPDCGLYEVTVGAINQLRLDAQMKAAVRAEIRRQLDSGVERPQINVELLQALKGR